MESWCDENSPPTYARRHRVDGAVDARAAETTRAIGFDGKCLRGKCETDHEMGYELLKRVIGVLGEHLDATRFQLLDIYADAIE